MKESDRVAIVIPLYRNQFSYYEEISLGLLNAVLPKYRKIIAKPAGLNLSLFDWETVEFNSHFFESHLQYSQLLLSHEFYQAFSNLEYILIYQADCLVFSDQLLDWCRRGYDYIGPLWDRKEIERWETVFWDYVDYGCGNGGFSLRNVKACIKTLTMAGREARVQMSDLKRYDCSGELLQEYTSRLLEGRVFSRNEDMFWGFQAKAFNPDFRIGTIEDALAFGFEYNPRKCIQMNNGKLPFGAHAWYKFEDAREFWLNILRQKYPLDELLLETC